LEKLQGQTSTVSRQQSQALEDDTALSQRASEHREPPWKEEDGGGKGKGARGVYYLLRGKFWNGPAVGMVPQRSLLERSLHHQKSTRTQH
jgi:hypothetical protein